MAESVILPDSAMLQHIWFNLGVKGSLRRATPALDSNIEPTQISKEAKISAPEMSSGDCLGSV